jgi:hypothetical protein
MTDRPRYAAIEDGGSTASGSVEEFLLRCILGAREEAGIPSNSSGFDEDVNIYVVGLLGRFMSSEYHEFVGRFFFRTDLDLAREVAAHRDDRFGYLAYRTNADQLLLGIGLFCQVDGHGVSNDPVFGRSPEELSGRGATYYNLASASLRRLRRVETGPELAMTKLAEQFDDYTTVLRAVRTSYFRLTSRLSDGELFHLGQTEDPEERRRRAWDDFLDAWSEWKRNAGESELDRLHDAVDALRAVDPDFNFEMPE